MATRIGIAVAAASGATLGIWFATRAPLTAPGSSHSASTMEPEPLAPTVTAAPVAASAPDAALVSQWMGDAVSGDAARRAHALKSLARAPREQALPVLSRALSDGEPVIDRPLALQSLRELALEQGDADGRVREAVRGALYHADDHASPEDLQETLDVIEESELR